MKRPIFGVGWALVALVIHESEAVHHLHCPTQECVMSLVRLLGFATLPCGCVVGRYRELATNREVAYVEEKGQCCDAHTHRRNHTVQAERIVVTGFPQQLATAKAS